MMITREYTLTVYAPHGTVIELNMADLKWVDDIFYKNRGLNVVDIIADHEFIMRRCPTYEINNIGPTDEYAIYLLNGDGNQGEHSRTYHRIVRWV